MGRWLDSLLFLLLDNLVHHLADIGWRLSDWLLDRLLYSFSSLSCIQFCFKLSNKLRMLHLLEILLVFPEHRLEIVVFIYLFNHLGCGILASDFLILLSDVKQAFLSPPALRLWYLLTTTCELFLEDTIQFLLP